MDICAPLACRTHGDQKRVASSGTGVTEGCEPLSRFQELNLRLLEEQPLLLPAPVFSSNVWQNAPVKLLVFSFPQILVSNSTSLPFIGLPQNSITSGICFVVLMFIETFPLDQQHTRLLACNHFMIFLNVCKGGNNVPLPLLILVIEVFFSCLHNHLEEMANP